MSRERIVLDIEPPTYSIIEVERFLINGFKCPLCSGRGNLRLNKVDGDVIKPCGRCDGSGLLTAKIELTWVKHNNMVNYGK